MIVVHEGTSSFSGGRGSSARCRDKGGGGVLLYRYSRFDDVRPTPFVLKGSLMLLSVRVLTHHLPHKIFDVPSHAPLLGLALCQREDEAAELVKRHVVVLALGVAANVINDLTIRVL